MRELVLSPRVNDGTVRKTLMRTVVMMLRGIFQNRASQKASLIASTVLGLAGIFSGTLQAVFGRPGSIGGLVAGTILVGMACIGFWGLKRKQLHSNVP
jgi:hypothetical protein